MHLLTTAIKSQYILYEVSCIINLWREMSIKSYWTVSIYISRCFYSATYVYLVYKKLNKSFWLYLHHYFIIIYWAVYSCYILSFCLLYLFRGQCTLYCQLYITVTMCLLTETLNHTNLYYYTIHLTRLSLHGVMFAHACFINYIYLYKWRASVNIHTVALLSYC